MFLSNYAWSQIQGIGAAFIHHSKKKCIVTKAKSNGSNLGAREKKTIFLKSRLS